MNLYKLTYNGYSYSKDAFLSGIQKYNFSIYDHFLTLNGYICTNVENNEKVNYIINIDFGYISEPYRNIYEMVYAKMYAEVVIFKRNELLELILDL